jgi:Retrotransposon gag protein
MSDSSVSSPLDDPSAELDLSNNPEIDPSEDTTSDDLNNLFNNFLIETRLAQTDSNTNNLEPISNSNLANNSNPSRPIIRPPRFHLNMAPPEFDLKNLCILPTFDGNPNDLHNFLTIANTLLTHYFDRIPANVGCLQNVLLLHGITSKLVGRAKEVVSIYGVGTWDDLKDILTRHFGDQRDENSLTRDLVNSRQLPNESPLQFYEKCMGLLNTLCNFVDLHENIDLIKRSKKDFFKQQTLTTFLAGLKEPLGSTIRAMRPQNLADAIKYIQEENNIRYLQRTSLNTMSVPKKTQPFQAPQFQPPQFSSFSTPPRFQIQQPFRQQSLQFPTGPVQITPRPAPPQRYFTNQQVFGKPKTQNVWAPKNNQASTSQPKPTPMSTTSRNTFQPKQPVNWKTYQRPQVVFEELHNLEENQFFPDYCEEQNYPENYEESYIQEEPEYTQEDQNFQSDPIQEENP